MVYLETHETISHYPQNHKIAQEQIKNTRLGLKETKRDHWLMTLMLGGYQFFKILIGTSIGSFFKIILASY